jgi:hypothetical protein
MGKPDSVLTPERKAYLEKLFIQSKGFCVLTHKPCSGEWAIKTRLVCAHHANFECKSPRIDGDCYEHNPENGNPIRCECYSIQTVRWKCSYGDYPCHTAKDISDDETLTYGVKGECFYPLYVEQLLKEWRKADKQIEYAELEAERKQLHSLGERRTPLRGRFNNISREIYYPRQPQYYLEGLGISGLTFKPFAKIQLANSYTHLYVDIGNALKAVSKSKRRKAIRYGKPLPKSVTSNVDDICNRAVRRYLNH